MQTIQIQSVGKVEAKPAIEFKAGEKMLWNFGYTSTIISVASETAAFITFLMQGKEEKPYERKFKKTRLVAIA